MRKQDRIERARNAGAASAGVPRGESSRINGRKGGRPHNPEIQAIMRERGVTRQRAWQILHEQD